MTELLETALTKIKQLPECEQNVIAALILEAIASEEKWDYSFSVSQDLLTQLSVEAIDEHSKGLTQVLDPDKL
jgi:hypothetical protein